MPSPWYAHRGQRRTPTGRASAMPTGVAAPHVGQRSEPGWSSSPQVEQRMKPLRIHALEGSGPDAHEIRTIRKRRTACVGLAPPASPPKRTAIDTPLPGLTR